jgi:hypothetical protein
MSLTIRPFEQSIAELGTLIGIHIGAKNAAAVAARAQAALQVSAALSAASSGDLSTAQTELAGVVSSASSDPGVKQFLGDLTSQASSLLQFNLQLGAEVPILGTAAQAIFGQAAAGIKAIASQYPAPPAATPAAAAPAAAPAAASSAG